MSDNSKIEWCSASWNPIRGTVGRHTCARISHGCDHCYAATMTRRGLGGTAPIDYGVGEMLNDPARLDDAALRQPLRWKKPRRIFVASMTDIAGAWVPDAWLDRIWAVMALAPQHTYMVLTKRPSRLWEWFRSDPYDRVLRAASQFRHERPGLIRTGISNPAKFPYRHVWIGVTIESDRYAWRANILRQIPAHVRWVSAEPLLSGLPRLNLDGIDWLVAGGESGPKARPMHPDWARDLRDRCVGSGESSGRWPSHACWRSTARTSSAWRASARRQPAACWTAAPGISSPSRAPLRRSERPMTRRRPVADRLRDLSVLDLATGCLVYKGSLSRHGYGRFHFYRDGKWVTREAHSVAYETEIGPVPEGMQLDHLCRNRACINVRHLEPVTPAENTRRGESFSAINSRLTHCRKGHEFTEENTYRIQGGWRQCRTCQREAVRRYASNRKRRAAS